MAKPPAGRQYKTWSRGRANRAGGLLSASAISVDALAVAGEQDDAGCEQADGAGVGSLEAAGKLVRIVVVEQGRSESIEALHEDLAAARAVARIEIHGASERLGFLERGGFEMTKRGNGLRARGRFIRLVAVDAPESGAERHRHLRPRGRRPHGRGRLRIERAREGMGATGCGGESALTQGLHSAAAADSSACKLRRGDRKLAFGRHQRYAGIPASCRISWMAAEKYSSGPRSSWAAQSCAATATVGIGTASAAAWARMRLKSLYMRRAGNALGNRFATAFDSLPRCAGEITTVSPSTSASRSRPMPAFSPSASASARICSPPPSRVFTTSFMVVPAPAGPMCTTVFAMESRMGRAPWTAPGSPPAKTTSAPCSACGGRPA